MYSTLAMKKKSAHGSSVKAILNRAKNLRVGIGVEHVDSLAQRVLERTPIMIDYFF